MFDADGKKEMPTDANAGSPKIVTRNVRELIE